MNGQVKIPRVIWQTNFTERFTLPLYINYLFNRRRAPDFEHYYVSTEAREEYIRVHASKRVYAAYQKLTDGAAQADLWRVVQLYNEGGIYMDIDATLVCNLANVLSGRSELFIQNYGQFSNFFMATVPGNPLFLRFIERIVENIETYSTKNQKPSVFDTTGPGALIDLLPENVNLVPHQLVSVQGAFTNEYFQYMDRPKSKWIYKKTFIK